MWPGNVAAVWAALVLSQITMVAGAWAAPERNLGSFRLTYYHIALETPPLDPHQANWPVYSHSCESTLALTTQEFHQELSLEGTGLLRDGRLVNFESRCDCARPGYKGLRSCYSELDRNVFPWGRGAKLGMSYLPLQPLHSVAVDPKEIPIGAVVFLPKLSGRPGPNGKTLSGCFRADDTGYAIRGRRLDLFTGRPAWTLWMQRTYRLERVQVVMNSPRCPTAEFREIRPSQPPSGERK
ncbi:MAG: 3D domain-containing protein [Deltaproteobacteria bacterium]|nr:3D domain-containing protein [Deltaproteobacteria bacterium]